MTVALFSVKWRQTLSASGPEMTKWPVSRGPLPVTKTTTSSPACERATAQTWSRLMTRRPTRTNSAMVELRLGDDLGCMITILRGLQELIEGWGREGYHPGPRGMGPPSIGPSRVEAASATSCVGPDHPS